MVGEVGAQLDELMVRSATFGDIQRCVEGIGGSQPIGMVDRQEYLTGPLWIADVGAEHEGVLRITGVEQRLDHSIERRRRWRR